MHASHQARYSLACLALVLTACAAIERPPSTVESLTVDGVGHDKTQLAPTPDYWFWLRRTGGVVDTTRFRAEIARTIDARMAERIANAAKQNRQLLIATTDFDLGVGRAWDLAAEMTRPATLDRAHD